MRKITALLLSITFIFLLSSCGEKPIVDPTEITASTSAVMEITEKPLPYWETHEIGTYAGLVNGARFSGNFGEFKQDAKCKNGDVVLSRGFLTGIIETEGTVNLAEEHVIYHPNTNEIFYDASEKRYSSVLRFKWEPYNEEAKQNCEEIIITNGKYDYFYSETSQLVPDSPARIEANDEYVVYIFERNFDDERFKIVRHYYWKKDAGLIGIYAYEDFQEINIRFTSKTADGWKMDETIVPNALEGSERKWPEKLWPEEYKGLDDPELLAILNEY